MQPGMEPVDWECKPGEVMVRNRTGVSQTFSLHGVTLQPGEWSPLPLRQAVQLRSSLIVDVYLPDDLDTYLWKDGRGHHVFWMSPFSLGDGYGTGAEHTINSAIDLGLNAKLHACWFLERRGILLRTLENIDRPIEQPYLVGICMATPGEFKKLPTPYKIGFTMYESTNPLKTHPEWKPECNAVDRLFVPSPWCKELFGSFLRSDLPIDVIPLTVNPLYCVAEERRPRETFTFISFATALTDRKGSVETSELFIKAFPRDRYPHVRLKLKAKLSDHFMKLLNARLAELNDDRIFVISANWLQEQMLEFMLDADAMLFLTYGEGFGLPPREALVTGLPVVLSDHTGMREFCNDHYVWPVPVKEQVPCPLGGDWFIPREDIAIDMMRDIVDHPEKAFGKAKRGADRYIAQNNARVLVKTIEGLEASNAVQSKWAQAREGPQLEASREELDYWRREHTPFIDKLTALQGPFLEVGLGWGATHAEMLLRGKDTHGIEVSPAALEACRENLRKAYGLEVSVGELDGFFLSERALSRLGLPARYQVAFSDGLLEHFSDREVSQLVRAMLSVADLVYFSVPSVYHPETYQDCRQMRKEQWLDIFNGARLSLRFLEYYGDGAYIMGCVDGESSGLRGAVVRYGRVNQGVWRPDPRFV
jgi:glycosyltransferase involved in cell wall biosynthesis